MNIPLPLKLSDALVKLINKNRLFKKKKKKDCNNNVQAQKAVGASVLVLSPQ